MTLVRFNRGGDPKDRLGKKNAVAFGINFARPGERHPEREQPKYRYSEQ
jgi:hypothetical protein